jgi:glycosyltransferase involved in cell wall biosynthesis
MRIIYVYFHCYDEMPYHVREWVEAAHELGHKITVITSISEEFLDKIGWTEKINVIKIPYAGRGIKNFLKLKKHFRNTISHAIKKERPELIYERFSQISGATADAAKQTKIPYCVEVNGIIENELALSGASRIRRLFFILLQKKVYKTATHIISVTAQIKNWLKTKYHVHESKILVQPNGVNINRFKPYDKNESRALFSLPHEKYIVGFLGSLFPWCGLEHLVAAAPLVLKEHPDTLFLIGGGQEPLKSNLENMVKEKGLEKNFIFAGQIPWNDAPRFISTFDIAVETKLNRNNTSFSPLKIYSYLSCGTPVIAPNLPEIRKLIHQSRAGELFQPENSQSLAESICAFRKFPDSKIRELRKNARRYVEENHSWRKIVSDSLKWIEKYS